MKSYIYKIWTVAFFRWGNILFLGLYFFHSFFFLLTNLLIDKSTDFSSEEILLNSFRSTDFLFLSIFIFWNFNQLNNSNLLRMVHYNDNSRNQLSSHYQHLLINFCCLYGLFVVKYFLFSLYFDALIFNYYTILFLFICALYLISYVYLLIVFTDKLIIQISILLFSLIVPPAIKYIFNLSSLPNRLVTYPLETVLVNNNYLPYLFTVAFILFLSYFFIQTRVRKLFL